MKNAEEYAVNNADKPEDVFKLHHAYVAGYSECQNQKDSKFWIVWMIMGWMVISSVLIALNEVFHLQLFAK